MNNIIILFTNNKKFLERNILVTGGAGFIGSCFVKLWIRKHPDDLIIVLDKLTYAGNKSNILDLIEKNEIIFIKGDINDSLLVDKLFKKYLINHIVNFAAETHVDRSINEPRSFLETNILGTYSLLEIFRKNWQEKNREKYWRFLHVSTDEVFGSLEINQNPFFEDTPYDPRSPYSASKASSDHLAMAWHHTYGIPLIISNCSNNYGPFQFPEKLIPLTLINILNGNPIDVYGDGKNIRDWLYVEDHCEALEMLVLNGKIGQKYCIGGRNEIQNIELVKKLCFLMDLEFGNNNQKLKSYPSSNLIRLISDRPGHDKRYAINFSKIKNELSWEPKTNIEKGLEKTVKWYLNNKQWWEPLLIK